MPTQIHGQRQIQDNTIGLGKVLISARVATTAAQTLATDFAAAQTIDGVTLVAGDRVLIKDQVTASENGIYIVQASGAPVHPLDFDANANVKCDMFTFVEEGTANQKTGWLLVTLNPIIVDTTDLVFQKFSGTIPVFVYHETPSGAIDSSNTAYTLAFTPVVGTVELFLNGVLQNPGVDYTITGTAITYASAPITGSILLAYYRTA